jgi:hypothetical protein
MKPSVVATIGLRIIAIWLLLQALFGSITLVMMHHAVLRGYPGIHARWYSGPAAARVPEGSFPDSGYLHSWFASTAASAGGRLLVGMGLLFGSRPIGRMVA